MKVSDVAFMMNVVVGKASQEVADKTLANTIEQSAQADHGRSRVLKKLVKDNDLWKDAQSKFNNVKQVFYKNTVPWLDGGWRLVKASEFFKVSERIGEAVQEANDAKAKLINEWNNIVANEIALSNGMNKQSDYPDVADLDRTFYVAVKTEPIPSSGDFRNIDGLSPEEAEELVKQAEEDGKRKFAGALAHVLDTVNKKVSHFKDRVQALDSSEKTRFHKSCVTALAEAGEFVKSFNLNNDPALDDLANQLQKVFDSINVNELKDDESVRSEAISDADTLLNKIQGIYSNA